MRGVLPLLPALLIACGQPGERSSTDVRSGEVVPLDRLLGDWYDMQDSGRTTVLEHWERGSDGMPVGVGYVLSGRDTVFIEHLGIVLRNDTLHYAVSIGRDGGEAVLFKLIHDRDSLVFSDPQHDMPQRIVYIPQGNDAWHTIVSGTNKGVARTAHYHFKRVTAAPQTP